MFHVKQNGDNAMKKPKKPPRLRKLLVCGFFVVAALAVAGLLSYCHILSRLVYIDRTTVYLEDLPQEFDGATILYVSDIDMVGLNGPGSAIRLMESLEALEPDMLILGGDYAGEGLFSKLNASGGVSDFSEERRELFSALADFQAPLGKYAVAGENEASAAELSAEMALGGVTYLDNDAGTITLNGQQIAMVGFSDYSQGAANFAAVARHASSDDCIIAVTHNPASIAGIITAEAGDSGQWCDLVLTGHTHAGQMVVFERSMLTLDELETRFPTGWSKEGGAFILVSPGVGCESVNLRFGTQAQAHLITLRRKTGFQFIDGQ